MGIRRLRALCVMALSLCVWMLPSFVPPAAADTTITLADPAHPCEGQMATLTWDAPAGVTGVTGYQITHMLVTPGGPPLTTTVVVGPNPTSLTFTLPFGLSTFLIRVITGSGTASDPFTTAGIMGNRAPQAMSWAGLGLSSVGKRSATVPFKWYGPTTWFVTGGVLPVTVVVTPIGPLPLPSPVTIGPLTGPALSNPAVATFPAPSLRNGRQYTFSAVTSNACGSSNPSVSPTYVPGVGPAWTPQPSPPLTYSIGNGQGSYNYLFQTSGVPARTYSLVNNSCGSWLSIGPFGFLSGKPPAPMQCTFSVMASNGVGIRYPGYPSTDIVAGPFTLTVTT